MSNVSKLRKSVERLYRQTISQDEHKDSRTGIDWPWMAPSIPVAEPVVEHILPVYNTADLPTFLQVQPVNQTGSVIAQLFGEVGSKISWFGKTWKDVARSFQVDSSDELEQDLYYKVNRPHQEWLRIGFNLEFDDYQLLKSMQSQNTPLRKDKDTTLPLSTDTKAAQNLLDNHHLRLKQSGIIIDAIMSMQDLVFTPEGLSKAAADVLRSFGQSPEDETKSQALMRWAATTAAMIRYISECLNKEAGVFMWNSRLEEDDQRSANRARFNREYSRLGYEVEVYVNLITLMEANPWAVLDFSESAMIPYTENEIKADPEKLQRINTQITLFNARNFHYKTLTGMRDYIKVLQQWDPYAYERAVQGVDEKFIPSLSIWNSEYNKYRVIPWNKLRDEIKFANTQFDILFASWNRIHISDPERIPARDEQSFLSHRETMLGWMGAVVHHRYTPAIISNRFKGLLPTPAQHWVRWTVEGGAKARKSAMSTLLSGRLGLSVQLQLASRANMTWPGRLPVVNDPFANLDDVVLTHVHLERLSSSQTGQDYQEKLAELVVEIDRTAEVLDAPDTSIEERKQLLLECHDRAFNLGKSVLPSLEYSRGANELGAKIDEAVGAAIGSASFASDRRTWQKGYMVSTITKELSEHKEVSELLQVKPIAYDDLQRFVEQLVDSEQSNTNHPAIVNMQHLGAPDVNKLERTEGQERRYASIEAWAAFAKAKADAEASGWLAMFFSASSLDYLYSGIYYLSSSIVFLRWAATLTGIAFVAAQAAFIFAPGMLTVAAFTAPLIYVYRKVLRATIRNNATRRTLDNVQETGYENISEQTQVEGLKTVLSTHIPRVRMPGEKNLPGEIPSKLIDSARKLVAENEMEQKVEESLNHLRNTPLLPLKQPDKREIFTEISDSDTEDAEPLRSSYEIVEHPEETHEDDTDMDDLADMFSKSMTPSRPTEEPTREIQQGFDGFGFSDDGDMHSDSDETVVYLRSPEPSNDHKEESTTIQIQYMKGEGQKVDIAFDGELVGGESGLIWTADAPAMKWSLLLFTL